MIRAGCCSVYFNSEPWYFVYLKQKSQRTFISSHLAQSGQSTLGLHSDIMSSLCFVCGSASACKRCQCGQAWYCSSECQQKDWCEGDPPHKDSCAMQLIRSVLYDTYSIPHKITRKNIEPFTGKLWKRIQQQICAQQLWAWQSVDMRLAFAWLSSLPSAF